MYVQDDESFKLCCTQVGLLEIRKTAITSLKANFDENDVIIVLSMHLSRSYSSKNIGLLATVVYKHPAASRIIFYPSSSVNLVFHLDRA